MNARLGVRKTYKLFIGGAFKRSESGRSDRLECSSSDGLAVNVCRASVKDLRDAVRAARSALTSWSARTAFNRGQILYRIAEMLEGRKTAFAEELQMMGAKADAATFEVAAAIDRLIHYSGWADKYSQLFSSVNPVATSHYNFSVPTPLGVVAISSQVENPLLAAISFVAPAICGGNTVVYLASARQPLSAISLGEVIQSSDVPAGVVNLLTGRSEDFVSTMASHMDVDGVIYAGGSKAEAREVQKLATENLKRVHIRKGVEGYGVAAGGPYAILDTQEIQTTWHPIGL